FTDRGRLSASLTTALEGARPCTGPFIAEVEVPTSYREGCNPHQGGEQMAVATAEPEVQSGLEGVVAFATEIAEPDKAGSALRYRGVDIEELVGRVPFEKVWGLLVDGAFEPGLPPAEPYNIAIHTGDVRADVQASVAMLAPMLGMGQTYDISDEQARL